MVGTLAEANLLTVARGLFGGARQSELQPLLFESWPAPPELSKKALRVLEDTLAKGAVTWLVRNGAWRERLWEKRAPLPLAFPPDAMRVLQWLLGSALGREGPTPLRVQDSGTIGCELLLLAALASVVGTAAERAVASQVAVRRSALCRVAFPVTLALAGAAELPPLTFDEGQDFVLAALQPALARWWRMQIRWVAQLASPAEVERAGLAQAATLDSLFAWADAQGRQDRCTFLLEALAPLLSEKASAADFVAAFDEKLPLKDRHAARRAAGAALMGVERLRVWDVAARHVRFIDDGYDAAQALVKMNETVFGNARFLLAERLRNELQAIS